MTERRFRDMSLTASDVVNMAWDHLDDGSDAGLDLFHKSTIRAHRLLPLWRQWAIERERLWGAVQALELDMEIDYVMPPDRLELRERLRRYKGLHDLTLVLR